MKSNDMDFRARLLITGGSGFLGGNLADMTREHWDTYATYNCRHIQSQTGVQWIPLDVTDKRAVAETVGLLRPQIVLHAAALTDSGFCERNPETAWEINVRGTENIAHAAEKAGARLIFTSTDMVFGRGGQFSSEEDTPSPTSLYSATKAAAELIVSSLAEDSIIARICLSYGYSLNSTRCFTEKIIEDLSRGLNTRLFVDEYRTPIYVPNLCEMLMELCRRKDLSGLFHLGGPERLSRYEFGLKICEVFDFPRDLLVPVSLDEMSFEYARPRDCSLNTGKLVTMLGIRPWSVGQGLMHMKSIASD